MLLVLRPRLDTHLIVAPGRHVQFRQSVPLDDSKSNNLVELVRSYTPVPQQFSTAAEEEIGEKGASLLFFLIKIYPCGALTPALGRLKPGETINVSDPSGSFIPPAAITGNDAENNGSSATGAKQVIVYMLAAGTGITPMLSLLPTIQQAVVAGGLHCRVVLVYFNRREVDIIGRAELELFATRHHWFSLSHVLSEDPAWSGQKGRIRKDLLSEHIITTRVSKLPTGSFCRFVIT